MDKRNKLDPMSSNISDVFSPHRRMHVSEQIFDVDFTHLGNPLVEKNYKSVYTESEQRDGTQGINKDDSLM